MPAEDKILGTNFSSVTSWTAGLLTEDVCGTDHSYDPTVLDYKKICDGYLVSIIGCLGVLGKALQIVYHQTFI